MPNRIDIPPDCDLTLPYRQIADIYRVSWSTALRWKKSNGAIMRRAGKAPNQDNLRMWEDLKRSDWDKGLPYVAMLMGVTPQVVCQMRERLKMDGQNVAQLRPARLARRRPFF